MGCAMLGRQQQIAKCGCSLGDREARQNVICKERATTGAPQQVAGAKSAMQSSHALDALQQMQTARYHVVRFESGWGVVHAIGLRLFWGSRGAPFALFFSEGVRSLVASSRSLRCAQLGLVGRPCSNMSLVLALVSTQTWASSMGQCAVQAHCAKRRFSEACSAGRVVCFAELADLGRLSFWRCTSVVLICATRAGRRR